MCRFRISATLLLTLAKVLTFLTSGYLLLCCCLYCRYVFCCSYTHNVAPKGKFIAFVSTEAETDDPQTELKAGIDLLGPVDEMFFDIYDRYEPVNEPSLDNCFISTVGPFPFSFTFPMMLMHIFLEILMYQ